MHSINDWAKSQHADVFVYVTLKHGLPLLVTFCCLWVLWLWYSTASAVRAVICAKSNSWRFGQYFVIRPCGSPLTCPCDRTHSTVECCSTGFCPPRSSQVHCVSVSVIQARDVTKFAFEFDNVRTSNCFSRFEIRQIFSRTRQIVLSIVTCGLCVMKQIVTEGLLSVQLPSMHATNSWNLKFAKRSLVNWFICSCRVPYVLIEVIRKFASISSEAVIRSGLSAFAAWLMWCTASQP